MAVTNWPHYDLSSDESMMFNRNALTYVIDDEIVDQILDDPANPLCQISPSDTSTIFNTPAIKLKTSEYA